MKIKATSRKTATQEDTINKKNSGHADLMEELGFTDDVPQKSDWTALDTECGMQGIEDLITLPDFDFNIRDINIPTTKIQAAADMLTGFCENANLTIRKSNIHIQSIAHHYSRTFLRYAVSEVPDGKQFFRLFIDMDRQTPRVLIEPSMNYIPNRGYVYGNGQLLVVVSGKSIKFCNMDTGDSEIFPIRESLKDAWIVPFYMYRGRLRTRHYFTGEELLPLCTTLKTGTIINGNSLNYMIGTAMAQSF